jgi:hypothetical protein
MREGKCGQQCVLCTAGFKYSRPWRFEFELHLGLSSLLSAARTGNATRQNIPAWPRSTAGFYGRDQKNTEKQQKFPTVITTAATTETLPANA